MASVDSASAAEAFPGQLYDRQRVEAPGLLASRQDLRLFTFALVMFLFDVCSISYWAATSEDAVAGYQRPLGGLQSTGAFAFEALYVLFNVSCFWRAVRANPLLWLVCALALASVGWSYDPSVSFKASLNLMVVVAFATTGLERHGVAVIVRRGFLVLTGLVLLNLAALALPNLSFMTGQLQGTFRGFTNHKNTLGPLVALHLALLLGQWDSPEYAGRLRMLVRWMVPIDLVMLLLTRSSTAIVIAAAALGIYLFIRVMRRLALDLRVVVIGALVILVGLGSLFLTIDDLLGLVGRDSSFTGRSQIWGLAMQYAGTRPWLGWGYKAFPIEWLLTTVPRADGYQRFVVGTTHSSYIELYSEIGIVGCVIYGVWILSLLARIVRLPPSALRTSAFLAFMGYLAAGLTESLSGLFAGLPLMLLLLTSARVTAFDKPRPE